MAVTGIVLGGIAVIASFGALVGVGAAVNSVSDNKPAAIVEATAPAADAAAKPVETAAPVEEPEAPVAPAVPVEYQSALTKAKSYSDLMHMSKAGIYDQLTSEYGEKFAPEAAQYAVDTLVADYNANALAKAKSYQETMSMSPEAIRDQLTSEYGEKFTPEEADYAILHLND
ncbi:Ltp family lipoprotein [Plantibacter flavus]